MSVALRAENAGVRLAYETHGQGAPLLLVQGLGYGGRGWGPAIERLAESFLVVSFDNRGFGASDTPPGPYTVAELASDAAAVLAAAEIERAHVMGASLGGMTAQELALSEPERVERLVLVSTTPGGIASYPMPAITARLMLEATALDPDVALRRFVENALGADGRGRAELVERILAYRRANPPDPAGWQAQAAAGATFDAFERVSSIEAETLVVHGTEDAVVDPRNARLLAERIPRARLELLEGCGHLPFWEQPERFRRLVRDFLAQR
jgi:pimeloyl-ACP methyl ester carboxylesterase